MRRLLTLFVLVLFIALLPTVRAEPDDDRVTSVTAKVADEVTGAPIPGAVVRVGDFEAVTDDQGEIAALVVRLPGASGIFDVAITAEGYEAGSYSGLELRENQPVTLDIVLRTFSVSLDPAGDSSLAPSEAGAASQAVMSFDPEQIVYLARTGIVGSCPLVRPVLRVDAMRFIDYVRNVLPNEWVGSWSDGSLDIGAVAVKQYGWYTAFVQQKWRRQGYDFDLMDNTCDQQYKDNSAQARTDQAFLRTWDLALINYPNGGTLAAIQYRNKDANCRIFPGCMGQVESNALADAGYSLASILQYYYASSTLVDLTPDLPADLPPQVYLPLVAASAPPATP